MDDETFYLFRNDAAPVIQYIQDEMMNLERTKIFWYPQVGEKFLFCFNNEYYRAQRIAESVTNPFASACINVQLIDVGEIMSIPVTKNTEVNDAFYMLPEKLQIIQPLAIKCKLIDTDFDDAQDRIMFLTDNLYEYLLTFEAVDVQDDLIYVQIWPYEQHDDEYDMYEGNDENAGPLDKPIFTQDELDELFEEPLNTEDPMEAVQGYSAREDEQLCQFYNPNTGACFKGSLCKMKHLPLPSAYDYRDRQETFIAKTNIEGITVDRMYEIKITAFISPNMIICCLDDNQWYDRYEEIQTKINMPNEVKNYKKIQFEPEVTQLVLVKLKEDFHRAKIITVGSESYVVWLVDLGCLKIAVFENLYEWTMRLEDDKHLTYEMEITNFRPIKGKHRLASLEILNQEKLCGSLRVKIL